MSFLRRKTTYFPVNIKVTDTVQELMQAAGQVFPYFNEISVGQPYILNAELFYGILEDLKVLTYLFFLRDMVKLARVCRSLWIYIKHNPSIKTVEPSDTFYRFKCIIQCIWRGSTRIYTNATNDVLTFFTQKKTARIVWIYFIDPII
ncbi:MAG: hypothetical protein AAGJ12_02250 [Bacteroidota bacterium]